MKTKIIIFSAVFSIIAIAAFNININSNNTDTSISLANIEALADVEGVPSAADCYYSYADVCYTRDTGIYHVNWYV